MSVRLIMSRSFLAAGVAVCAISAPLLNASYTTPAAAQAVSLSVEFRTALEPYGSWQQSSRWGEVWLPAYVTRGWQPYTVGHWVFSEDYGWYWVSEESEATWGTVVYHYGRWIDDDELGWVWVPGNTWGPGWVLWRHGRGQVGWAPLPPDELAIEYRERRPEVWTFVRERDLLAPRVTQVILPPQEREVVFRETVVVNRTVVLEDRRFAVNPGIPPTYIAAEIGRPIPRFEVRPYVLAGTATLPGAIQFRAEDIRSRERAREITRESTFVRETSVVQPARNAPPPQPLGPNERGRLLTDVPLRAVQGAAPGQPLQQQGRDNRLGTPGTPGAPPTGAFGDRRTLQPGRDQRELREGRPATPGAPPVTSGAAPNVQPNGVPGGRAERDLRQGRPEMRGESPRQPSRQPQVGGEQRGSVGGIPPGRDMRGNQPGGPSTTGAVSSMRERGSIGPQGGAREPGREPPGMGNRSQPPTTGAAPGMRERGPVGPQGGAREPSREAPGMGNRSQPSTTGAAPGMRERGPVGPQGGAREPSREPPGMGNRAQPSTTGAAPRSGAPGPGRRDER